MLKRSNNLIIKSEEDWGIIKYRYDESKYNPDSIDSVPAVQLYDSYLKLCATCSKSAATIKGLGNIHNTNGVQNVSTGGMDRKKGCLGSAASIMDNIVNTFGNVVNQTFAGEQSASGMYLPKDVDDLAAYLKDYATKNSDDVLNLGGVESFNMYEFGNYAEAYAAEVGDTPIPYYNKPIADPYGNITEDYKSYVYSHLFDENGKCLYENVQIDPDNIKINPANGNVQFKLRADEGNGYSANVTVTINPTDPNALANAYVCLPGTGGGDSYLANKNGDPVLFTKLVNDNSYNNDSKYMVAVYSTPPTRHHYSDAALAEIMYKFVGSNEDTGEKNLVNKAVVSGASAGGVHTINVVRELKDITAEPVDIMLIDDAYMDGNGMCESCQNFHKGLTNPNNKDVLDYLKQGSVIIAYEAGQGNDGNKYLQDLADQGIKTMVVTNDAYKSHCHPEYNIFAGEVERVMSGFEDKKSSTPQVSNLATETNQPKASETNPYLEAYPITDEDSSVVKNSKTRFAYMINKQEENKYFYFEPDGNGKRHRMNFNSYEEEEV